MHVLPVHAHAHVHVHVNMSCPRATLHPHAASQALIPPHTSCITPSPQVLNQYGDRLDIEHLKDLCDPELTRTPRRLRWVRTGYAYPPPALCTHRTRRAACPQGPAYCTHWVRVPASAVPYVPRTVAPQAAAEAAAQAVLVFRGGEEAAAAKAEAKAEP